MRSIPAGLAQEVGDEPGGATGCFDHRRVSDAVEHLDPHVRDRGVAGDRRRHVVHLVLLAEDHEGR
ncbi:hypothetical protein [Amycolatopsis palatopharyngis]|uniref:hypothetical protein n=1 Tax=Amycolatopsis palatopharyngis TaxID=187982 RepID=UPI001FE43E5C|nr:hypothetical protein [Amycolatopsis palatopharyngis]